MKDQALLSNLNTEAKARHQVHWLLLSLTLRSGFDISQTRSVSDGAFELIAGQERALLRARLLPGDHTKRLALRPQAEGIWELSSDGQAWLLHTPGGQTLAADSSRESSLGMLRVFFDAATWESGQLSDRIDSLIAARGMLEHDRANALSAVQDVQREFQIPNFELAVRAALRMSMISPEQAARIEVVTPIPDWSWEESQGQEDSQVVGGQAAKAVQGLPPTKLTAEGAPTAPAQAPQNQGTQNQEQSQPALNPVDALLDGDDGPVAVSAEPRRRSGVSSGVSSVKKPTVNEEGKAGKAPASGVSAPKNLTETAQASESTPPAGARAVSQSRDNVSVDEQIWPLLSGTNEREREEEITQIVAAARRSLGSTMAGKVQLTLGQTLASIKRPRGAKARVFELKKGSSQIYMSYDPERSIWVLHRGSLLMRPNNPHTNSGKSTQNMLGQLTQAGKLADLGDRLLLTEDHEATTPTTLSQLGSGGAGSGWYILSEVGTGLSPREALGITG